MSWAAALPAPTLPPQVSPPTFEVSAAAAHEVAGVEAVALPVLCGEGDLGPLLGPGAADVGDRLGLDLADLVELHRLTGRPGEVASHPVGAAGDDLRWVVLVGVGSGERSDVRRAAAALARHLAGRTSVATTLAALAPDLVEPVVAGAVLGSFVFRWSATPPERPPLERVVLLGGDAGPLAQAALDRAVAIALAAWRARALASVPSNLKSPQWLADQATEIASGHGLAVQVWDERELAAQGFGGILAVGRASATPPRLIRLDHEPPGADDSTPTVVLVGKGITFDTGGLSIKPAEGMTTMKRDMTGGAVVLATLSALAAVGCPVRVVGLVAAAENAVGGDAYRPGDVVTHWGGRTTEVTNTDAEGRVVMADALAYAVAELAPRVVVDVATLTGAVKVALGQQTGGLFANHDALAAALTASADRAGEPLWRLPLARAYEEKLSSPVADADNAPGGPGAITAALFLQHFVGEVAWAHLDIASVGDAPTDSHEWTTGPTGFGARTLLEWLGGPDPLAGI